MIIFKNLSFIGHALFDVKIKVYDGISLSSCVVEDKQTTFTYTAGTLAGGLIEEYKLTKNKTLLQIAHNISSTVLIYLSDK